MGQFHVNFRAMCVKFSSVNTEFLLVTETGSFQYDFQLVNNLVILLEFRVNFSKSADAL